MKIENINAFQTLKSLVIIPQEWVSMRGPTDTYDVVGRQAIITMLVYKPATLLRPIEQVLCYKWPQIP